MCNNDSVAKGVQGSDVERQKRIPPNAVGAP